MSLFPSAKLATFAAAAFKAIGLDLAKLQAAGDDNALKAHVEAAGAAAKPSADLEAAVTEAATENNRLTSALAQANKDKAAITEGRAALAATLDPLTAALATHGVKLEACQDDKGVFSAEKFNTALKAHISKQATLELAKSGTHPVAHEIGADSGTTTMKRAEFNKLNAKKQAEFSAQVRAGAAKLLD